MTCRDIAGFLHDYVAGELPADVLAEFERHLVDCANCREYLNQYRETIARGQAVGSEAGADIPEDLVNAVLKTIRGPAPP
jgi:anti-sigma factor RsiW